MTVAAIYARRSTEQRVAQDQKSVTRQIEKARDFASHQGWTISPDHIFIDDGVSGAGSRNDRGCSNYSRPQVSVASRS